MYAPVLLFVYNRPAHVRRTVEALRANLLAAESDLYVYSDAAKDESSLEAVRTGDWPATSSTASRPM